MIEYHGLCSAVGATASSLDAATGDPALTESAKVLRVSLDAARLGACVGPLLEEADG
jgi:hypothetical protein